MISFRTKNDSVASLIAILAILMLAGTLAFMLFVPNPTETGVIRGKPHALALVKGEVDDIKKETADVEAATKPLLWEASAAEIAPQALSSITKLAIARKVKILAFRPQKSTDSQGLTLMPFTLTVDGSYPNVMQLVKDLENSELKLAVSLVQVGASDGATDHVTGTVTIVAYMKTQTPKPTTKTPTTEGGTDAKKPK